jgi:hypothetical protein
MVSSYFEIDSIDSTVKLLRSLREMGMLRLKWWCHRGTWFEVAVLRGCVGGRDGEDVEEQDDHGHDSKGGGIVKKMSWREMQTHDEAAEHKEATKTAHHGSSHRAGGHGKGHAPPPGPTTASPSQDTNTTAAISSTTPPKKSETRHQNKHNERR